MIEVGQTIPEVTVHHMTPDGPKAISTKDLFTGKRVLMFALPGAFTPTCSAAHLPGYVVNADAIKGKGVDEIVCMSVNDAFVMDAWGKAHNVDDNILMLADGNGEFAKALGLTMDGSGFGMGTRSQRFALLAEDGKVTDLQVEAPREFKVSSAEAMLERL